MFRKVRPAFVSLRRGSLRFCASLQANAGGWGGITLPLVIQKCAPLIDVASTPYRLWRQVDYPNSALAISVTRINKTRPRLKKLCLRAGGWGGIRTLGAFRHTRFPGVHNRPLCHPSRRIEE